MPMGDVINLLDRRLYTFAQVDDLLSLSPSTAQRWIDGYSRQGKTTVRLCDEIRRV